MFLFIFWWKKRIGRSSQVPAGVPRNRENWRTLCHILGPRRAIPRPGARAGSGLCRKALSSPGVTKKGKIIVVFFRLMSFRRVWLSPKKNRRFFYQNSGGVLPTGDKKTQRGMRKIRQKGGCLRWDMSHFSSENFDFRVLSE